MDYLAMTTAVLILGIAPSALGIGLIMYALSWIMTMWKEKSEGSFVDIVTIGGLVVIGTLSLSFGSGAISAALSYI